MSYDQFVFPFSEPEVLMFTLARMILGILLFFQAYDRMFRIGLSNVLLEVSKGCGEKGVPVFVSKVSVYGTSILELIAGLLLLFGLFTPLALLVLCMHFVLVVLAFSFLDGMWDMKHVFPRLALLLFLLALPLSWNLCSLDYFLGWM